MKMESGWMDGGCVAQADVLNFKLCYSANRQCTLFKVFAQLKVANRFVCRLYVVRHGVSADECKSELLSVYILNIWNALHWYQAILQRKKPISKIFLAFCVCLTDFFSDSSLKFLSWHKSMFEHVYVQKDFVW